VSYVTRTPYNVLVEYRFAAVSEVAFTITMPRFYTTLLGYTHSSHTEGAILFSRHIYRHRHLPSLPSRSLISLCLM
jgi:hypothetical protein